VNLVSQTANSNACMARGAQGSYQIATVPHCYMCLACLFLFS